MRHIDEAKTELLNAKTNMTEQFGKDDERIEELQLIIGELMGNDANKE